MISGVARWIFKFLTLPPWPAPKRLPKASSICKQQRLRGQALQDYLNASAAVTAFMNRAAPFNAL